MILVNHVRLILLQLLVCFGVALFVTLRDRWSDVGIALVTPTFYYAFIVSFSIALLLLLIVNRVNRWLNYKFPLSERPVVRILLQIAGGILLPVALDILFLMLYAHLFNRSFDLILERDLQFAFLFLGIINVIHILNKQPDKEVLRSKKILIIRHNGIDMNLDAITEILFVYKDRRNIQIATISGQVYSKRETLNAFIKEYGECGFFQVNPSAIVNLHMVSGAGNGSRAKTIEPLFKAQFQAYISHADLEKLAVTRKYISNFRTELKKRRTGDVQI